MIEISFVRQCFSIVPILDCTVFSVLSKAKVNCCPRFRLADEITASFTVFVVGDAVEGIPMFLALLLCIGFAFVRSMYFEDLGSQVGMTISILMCYVLLLYLAGWYKQEH